MSTNKSQSNGTLTINFNLKTLWTLILFIAGFGGGVFSLGTLGSNIVPTQKSVAESTEKIVIELQSINRELASLRSMRYDVEDNTTEIDSLAVSVKMNRTNQIQGFGVLWEQNELVLERLSDMNDRLEQLER